MTAEAFLARLDGVRRTSRGWAARCIAHDDRSPSLSIREGERGLLVKCWAGCTAKEIVKALGLAMSDLFYDAPRGSHQRAMLPPRPRPFDWRRESSDLLHRAEEFELRADYARAHTRGLDCSRWTDQDIDAALVTVAQANCDGRMAAIFRDVACSARALCLTQEEKRHESIRTVA